MAEVLVSFPSPQENIPFVSGCYRIFKAADGNMFILIKDLNTEFDFQTCQCGDPTHEEIIDYFGNGVETLVLIDELDYYISNAEKENTDGK